MKKILFLCAFLVPSTAQAGEFYAGVHGGIVLPNDTHISASGVATGSGDISYKTGYQFGGFMGYKFTPMLAGEMQIDYSQADYDKLSGTLNGTSGNADINGSISAFTGLANVIVSPVKMGGFAPYLGAGAGMAFAHSEISSIAGVAVGSDNDETDLALDALLGFNYDLSKDLSIGARYQYLWVDSGSSDTASGLTLKQDDFTAHILTARLNWKFPVATE